MYSVCYTMYMILCFILSISALGRVYKSFWDFHISSFSSWFKRQLRNDTSIQVVNTGKSLIAINIQITVIDWLLFHVKWVVFQLFVTRISLQAIDCHWSVDKNILLWWACWLQIRFPQEKEDMLNIDCKFLLRNEPPETTSTHLINLLI